MYSPPSRSGARTKSFCATPLVAWIRFWSATAPRGEISYIMSPIGAAPTSEPVARRSARNQIVSPGWYSGLSVIT